MTEYSTQWPCEPPIGDFGEFTPEKLSAARLLMGNNNPQNAGVIFWNDTNYIPNLPGITATVEGLYNPTLAGNVVTIASGVGAVNGYLHVSDADTLFDFGATPGNNGATDYIVLQCDIPNNVVRIVRKNGAIGSEAVLVQNPVSIWETLICKVPLNPGGTPTGVSDFRRLTTSGMSTWNKIHEVIVPFGMGVTGAILDLDLSTLGVSGLFTHLKIVCNLAWTGTPGGVGSIESIIRFNADIGANYDWVSSDSGVIGSIAGSTFIRFHISEDDSTTVHDASNIEAIITDYNNADYWKNIRISGTSNGFAALPGIWDVAGRWQNTAPITRLTISPRTTDRNLEGKVSIYGIK